MHKAPVILALICAAAVAATPAQAGGVETDSAPTAPASVTQTTLPTEKLPVVEGKDFRMWIEQDVIGVSNVVTLRTEAKGAPVRLTIRHDGAHGVVAGARNSEIMAGESTQLEAHGYPGSHGKINVGFTVSSPSEVLLAGFVIDEGPLPQNPGCSAESKPNAQLYFLQPVHTKLDLSQCGPSGWLKSVRVTGQHARPADIACQVFWPNGDPLSATTVTVTTGPNRAYTIDLSDFSGVVPKPAVGDWTVRCVDRRWGVTGTIASVRAEAVSMPVPSPGGPGPGGPGPGVPGPGGPAPGVPTPGQPGRPMP